MHGASGKSAQGAGMPNYQGTSGSTTLPTAAPGIVNSAPPLGRGESVYFFGVLSATATQLPVNPTNVAGETPAPPQASISVNIGDYQEQGPAPGVCVEGQFSGAPGAFSLQIQEADTDADVFYITPATATYTIAAVSSNNTFRADLIPTGGRFLRALLASRTNAVSLILKVTRLQP